MTRFRHIYDNEDGYTCFDKYFSYLQTVSKDMPALLFDFANNENRYTLNGEHTLHDAWLTSLVVSKEYSGDGETSSTANIVLLLATHETSLSLVYNNVIDMKCSLAPEFWPSRPVDLLVHEFTINQDGSFRHLFQFDREVWIELIFLGFSFEELKCEEQ